MHGCDVARRLGIKRVICPPGAGVASAVGLLIAPARVDRAMTTVRHLCNISPAELETAFMDLERDAGRVIKDTLTPGATFFVERAADIRFVGQGFEIVTQLPNGPYTDDTPTQIRSRFATAYERIFGQVPSVGEIELINLRVSAIEKLSARPLNLSPSGKEAWKVGKESRIVWDEAGGVWRSLRVIARD